MLDEEIQMEIVNIETREFGIQTVEKMAITQAPATAKIKKTYKIITLEKKDMLDVKDAMKQGVNQGNKKRKIKVYTGSDSKNIPETYKDQFDPNIYALEEVEEIEEVEPEPEVNSAAQSAHSHRHKTPHLKPNINGVEKYI